MLYIAMVTHNEHCNPRHFITDIKTVIQSQVVHILRPSSKCSHVMFHQVLAFLLVWGVGAAPGQRLRRAGEAQRDFGPISSTDLATHFGENNCEFELSDKPVQEMVWAEEDRDFRFPRSNSLPPLSQRFSTHNSSNSKALAISSNHASKTFLSSSFNRSSSSSNSPFSHSSSFLPSSSSLLQDSSSFPRDSSSLSSSSLSSNFPEESQQDP